VLTVLAIVADEDLYEAEKRAIAMYGTLSPGGYNLTAGGEAGCSKHPEVRAKLSAAMKNRAAETIAKIADANRGRKHSPETRAKIAAAARARPPASAETRAKLSEAQRARAPASAETLGKKSVASKNMSAETRAKIAAAVRGQKRSAETRAKMAFAKKNMSAETRAKMSSAMKANWAARKAKKSATGSGLFFQT
jgi:hypothetical protein